MLVRYAGQQDASTSEVSIWSTNHKCHTTLSNSNISQPKVNESQRCHSQQLTQNSSSKKSTQLGQSQRSTSISVPKNADCRNQNFDQDWGQFDHVLTKVNAGQLCAKSLGRKQKILLVAISHVWMKKSLQGVRTNQMMRENVM